MAQPADQRNVIIAAELPPSQDHRGGVMISAAPRLSAAPCTMLPLKQTNVVLQRRAFAYAAPS
jgi:hypothetical protein